MSPLTSFACAGLVDGVPCTQRANVEARAAAVARVRLALAGWTLTDGGVFCPTCTAQAPTEATPDPDPAPVRATTTIARPVQGVHHYLQVTGSMHAVTIVDGDTTVCEPCADGDHYRCRPTGCECTALVSCGGRS